MNLQDMNNAARLKLGFAAMPVLIGLLGALSLQRVGEISAASKEQSAGVSQVGEAVTHMDRATQQNAALVKQSTAASESLRLS